MPVEINLEPVFRFFEWWQDGVELTMASLTHRDSDQEYFYFDAVILPAFMVLLLAYFCVVLSSTTAFKRIDTFIYQTVFPNENASEQASVFKEILTQLKPTKKSVPAHSEQDVVNLFDEETRKILHEKFAKRRVQILERQSQSLKKSETRENISDDEDEFYSPISSEVTSLNIADESVSQMSSIIDLDELLNNNNNNHNNKNKTPQDPSDANQGYLDNIRISSESVVVKKSSSTITPGLDDLISSSSSFEISSSDKSSAPLNPSDTTSSTHSKTQIGDSKDCKLSQENNTKNGTPNNLPNSTKKNTASNDNNSTNNDASSKTSTNSDTSVHTNTQITAANSPTRESSNAGSEETRENPGLASSKSTSSPAKFTQPKRNYNTIEDDYVDYTAHHKKTNSGYKNSYSSQKLSTLYKEFVPSSFQSDFPVDLGYATEMAQLKVGYHTESPRPHKTKLMYDDSSNKVDLEDEELLSKTWNERFQIAVKTIRGFDSSTLLKNRIEGNLNLLHLSKDFLFTAQMYGKIIISEVYLPPEEKTIKPIFKGVIGGEKYQKAGILFKFAVDRDELFGSDYAAAKVAGHELKGLTAFLNCEQAVHFSLPLICLVDYRGFRLIALSILPIDDSTLIYGSADAGKIIRCDSKEKVFLKCMKSAANSLNIAPHYVGSTFLYSPVDLEGHKGKDGNYYLLDFSRVFPPEAPYIPSIKNAHLSRLLRPEFVRMYSTNLCSDAFSGFLKFSKDAKKHNEAVVEATQWLLRTYIPKFAKTELHSYLESARASGRLEQCRLTECIHRHGINCRYLGMLRKEMSVNEFRQIILVEIIARVLKNNLRLRLRIKMKELKRPLEEPYIRVITQYLNLVFANTKQSKQYWNVHIKNDVMVNFMHALSMEEQAPHYSFKPDPASSTGSNFLALLLLRFVKMTALKVTPRVFNPTIFAAEEALNDTDILELPIKVKHPNIVSSAEGFFYHIRGLTKRVEDPETSSRLYQMAIDKFEEALDFSPNNKEILINLGLTFTWLLEDEFATELQQSNTFPKDKIKNHVAVSKAREYFLRAIYAKPQYDDHSLFLYAYFLERCGNFDDCEDYYLQSLEANPDNATCLLQYGVFLADRGEHQMAEEFFKKASALTSNNPTSFFEWNWWGKIQNSSLSDLQSSSSEAHFPSHERIIESLNSKNSPFRPKDARTSENSPRSFGKNNNNNSPLNNIAANLKNLNNSSPTNSKNFSHISQKINSGQNTLQKSTGVTSNLSSNTSNVGKEEEID